MKKISSLTKLVLSLIFCTLILKPAMADTVLATVNGTPILQSQVQAFAGKLKMTSSQQRKSLDAYIDKILVDQAVATSGVKVTNAQVDQVIQNIADKNGLTFGQFLDVLDYHKVNYQQYRQNIAQQILMSEVQHKTISENIKVDRQDIEKLAEQMYKKAEKSGKLKKTYGKEYEVEHILLKVTPIFSDKQAKAELTKIRKEILSGKVTFAQMAEKYSQDYLSGANGGNLGWSFAERYEPTFAKYVMNTPKGKISQPFKGQYGWHILEVTGVRKEDRTMDAYRQQAYLDLANKNGQQQAANWTKSLRERVTIDYLK